MWGPLFAEMGFTDCGSRRARWGFGSFDDLWMGRGPGHRHWRGRAARMFGQGDLKYVVLRLLEEKPRHGYEIIKELESRFGGSYTPSPGTVYPTLTMLEDLGFARVVPEEGGKKIYEITDEGRKYLAEHSTTVDDIFNRIARFVGGFTDDAMMEVNHAMRRTARATYGTATRHLEDKELLGKIRAILDRAANEIESLAK